MTDKFIDMVNGRKTLKAPVVTSSGVADAGRLVALGANGKLDPSLDSAKHTQSVPAKTWVFNHGLGRKPAITVHDSAGTEVKTKVTYPTENQAVIDMAYAISGTAHAS